jgi:hypothetical protein
MSEEPQAAGAPAPDRSAEATVWAVRLGRETDGRKGKLRIAGAELVFDAEREAASRRIPLASVRKVKTATGSPVLLVEFRDGKGQPATTAFYFAQPPPLAPRRGKPEPASTDYEPPPMLFGSQGGGNTKRRRVRMTGMASLMGWNRLKKVEVAAWRERVKRAVREAGGKA